MELHALPQLEFKCPVVDPFPCRCQLPFVFVRLGIAIDQRIPHMVADDHADANGGERLRH
jgi:hypothetical protein